MRYLYFALLTFCYFSPLRSQPRTVGVVNYDNRSKEGYCLFSPVGSKKTFLIDKCGRLVHQWVSNYPPGFSVALLPNGDLVRAGNLNLSKPGGNFGGLLEKYDWNGNLLWHYSAKDSFLTIHHDFKVMPNGNILVFLYEGHTAADAMANGRDPNKAKTEVWSERIQELKPFGTDSAIVVWEWRFWDHLVQDFDSTKSNYGNVSNHRELMDINFTNTSGSVIGPDWLHLNSIDYNEELDQIVVSAHSVDEIYIIDHSTTTSEAAGHSGGLRGKGGDILYRWGNSRAYEVGDSANWNIFHGHHANWVPDGMSGGGEILVFNNGLNRPGPGSKYSTVDRIKPPMDSFGNYTFTSGSPFLPATAREVYKAKIPYAFFSAIMSGAYQIANNRIFATLATSGVVCEFAGDSLVWKYVNPVSTAGTIAQGQVPQLNSVFRYEFYPPDYPAFDNKSMIAGNELEASPYFRKLCDGNLVHYIIKTINRQSGTTGISDSLNLKCIISGTIQSANFSDNACNYVMADHSGSILFSEPGNDQRWKAGDSLLMIGKVGQKAGWCIFTNIDTIRFLGNNGRLLNAIQINKPTESYESLKVQLRRMKLKNPGAWPASPLSTGVVARLAMEHTNGTIDSMYIVSASNIDGSPAPMGYFNVTGFVGQFDNSQPYLSNYVIIPQSIADFSASPLPIINFASKSDTADALASSHGIAISNIPAEENFTASLQVIGGNALEGTDYYFTIKNISFSAMASLITENISINSNPDFTGTRSVKFALRNVMGPGMLGKDSVFTLYLRGKNNGSVQKFHNNDLFVYPVPFARDLHISALTDMSKIVFYEISGKLVRTINVSGKQVMISPELPVGNYTLAIQFSDGAWSYRNVCAGKD